MFQKFSDHISSCRNWYYSLSKQIHLSSVIIKNQKLAQELEDACAKHGGILTYGQYAQIEQYGQNGYHANYDKNGFTDVNQRWATALANYCLKNDFNSIIEFGCGGGELGVATIKSFKKLTKRSISWSGVEINKELHEEIRKNFKKEKIENSLKTIISYLGEITEKNKVLVIFPYSLDSIPSEIFLNDSQKISYPDTLLGIRVKDGRLYEEIIPQSILQQKGINLNNGLYRSGKSYSFDLKSWKLRKGQRAYIPVGAFGLFLDYVNKMPSGSNFIIIDEFRYCPYYFSAGALGIPKDLYAKSKEYKNIAYYYKEAGKHICYYPIYLESFFKFLHSAGFRSIQYDIEQKMAAELSGKKWVGLKQRYFTQVFIAEDRIGEKNDIIPIVYFPKKFV